MFNRQRIKDLEEKVELQHELVKLAFDRVDQVQQSLELTDRKARILEQQIQAIREDSK